MSLYQPPARRCCDLCGYGSGAYDDCRGVAPVGDAYDLCVWCRTPATAWIESGKHLVTFTEDRSSWTCSCGGSYAAERPTGLPQGLLAVVPSLPTAAAQAHISGRTL